MMKEKKIKVEYIISGKGKNKKTELGGIKVGENLVIDESGTLSASAVQEVIKDDDRPVSGGAVYEIVGEVENILSDV